jgi:hypothetical protein
MAMAMVVNGIGNGNEQQKERKAKSAKRDNPQREAGYDKTRWNLECHNHHHGVLSNATFAILPIQSVYDAYIRYRTLSSTFSTCPARYVLYLVRVLVG